MRLIGSLVAVALLAGCASAPETASAPAPTPAPAAKAAAPAPQQVAAVSGPKASDPNKRICRKSTPTGSNMPKRDCATQAEWDARDNAGRAQAEDIHRQINSLTGQSQ